MKKTLFTLICCAAGVMLSAAGFPLPAVEDAAAFAAESTPKMRAVFYEGEVFNKKTTKVFAWIGLPENPSGKPVPGIVLAHGAGGTAFRYWAKLWTDRGYAVIAPDLTGGVPKQFGDNGKDTSIRHADGGPLFRNSFRHAQLPENQQWAWHADQALIRAHSILRSLPEVDKNKTGLIGLSWGGIIGMKTLAKDPRFSFAVIIYSNGFLHENSFFKERELAMLPPEQRERWIALFDPSNYIGKTDIPILFVNGATDKHFRPDSWRKTIRLVKKENRYTALRPGMAHSHPPAGDPPEVAAFVNFAAKNAAPPPRLERQEKDAAYFRDCQGNIKGFLHYTLYKGSFPARKWKTVPAQTDPAAGKVFAAPPENAAAYFFSVQDSRNLITSSEMEIIE